MNSLWLEYAWTLLVLIGLEGILSADNALVIAVIAKHLVFQSSYHPPPIFLLSRLQILGR
ncbi:hypothetical protein MUB24_11310 [Lederbergia sp. NSJ-179]|uniref:hypothetical protein n=1 Tax=Lederbergia sp. NSJ-179 TaxID=2931402 RepID=UPI001FCFDE30|nr:hypothetical protein [Lederbergia sp. NSJ-179]MCJ7841472.1 hypothetical protein [Lederbergia sp. NSJ-179]